MTETVNNAATPGPQKIVHQKSNRMRWIGLAIAVVVGLVMLALPTPQGLTQTGHTVLAIIMFTAVLWIFSVMNNGATGILMMGLMIAAHVKPGVVLGAFAGGGFWILLCVLFYGLAMTKTGLARRISFYILSIFPATYLGIQLSFLVIGLLLSLGIPSNTVRVAIMVPIAWSMTKALGLANRSNGAALIMLTATEMSFIPGNTWIYGSLLGPLVEGLFRSQNLAIGWGSFFLVCGLPNIVICVLMVLVNTWMFKPEAPLAATHTIVSENLKSLGKVTRHELITALVIVLSVCIWVTQGRLHNFPAYLVGMVALAVFYLTGVVKDADVGNGIPWMLLIFIGTAFGMAEVVKDVKIADWLGRCLAPMVQHFTFSTVVLLMVVVLAMFVLRFVDATGFIAFAVLFLPIYDLLRNSGVPPLVLMGALVLANTPFWIPYQNAWIAIGEGITEGQAFSPKQRVKSATAYAVIVLVVVGLSVGYWKLVHLL